MEQKFLFLSFHHIDNHCINNSQGPKCTWFGTSHRGIANFGLNSQGIISNELLGKAIGYLPTQKTIMFLSLDV